MTSNRPVGPEEQTMRNEAQTPYPFHLSVPAGTKLDSFPDPYSGRVDAQDIEDFCVLFDSVVKRTRTQVSFTRCRVVSVPLQPNPKDRDGGLPSYKANKTNSDRWIVGVQLFAMPEAMAKAAAEVEAIRAAAGGGAKANGAGKKADRAAAGGHSGKAKGSAARSKRSGGKKSKRKPARDFLRADASPGNRKSLAPRSSSSKRSNGKANGRTKSTPSQAWVESGVVCAEVKNKWRWCNADGTIAYRLNNKPADGGGFVTLAGAEAALEGEMAKRIGVKAAGA